MWNAQSTLTAGARDATISSMDADADADPDAADARLVRHLWAELAAPATRLPSVTFAGGTRLLPSIYDVGALASASVALATAAAADLGRARTGVAARNVGVDRRHAAAAFRSERYLEPRGWTLPPIWDPIAGDYPARDGWIRLHTNYAHHRAAVLRVLGVPEDRAAVAAAVARWSAGELESAVVGAGGAAACMRTAAEFARLPAGAAVAREPLFAVERSPAAAPRLPGAAAPLAGVRVLDLTRVIAGPVCTRFLAAHGADVLRVDPPGFAEVGALLAETTVGKRRTFLDLRDDADRAIFERLVAGAHVVVHGYRSDALEALGLGDAWMRRLQPSLIAIALDAHGWTGPWAQRRGFDSLVQMSVGIAAAGAERAGSARPVPLPAQALDHGTGYLMAAAACQALVHLVERGEASRVKLSLARTAKLLMDLGVDGAVGGRDLGPTDVAPYREDAETALGQVSRIRCPGSIDGTAGRWTLPAGPLGSDPPAWDAAEPERA
jgi:hypothetical protein